MFSNRFIYLFYEFCMSNIILIRQNFILKFYFFVSNWNFYIVVEDQISFYEGIGREWWFVLSRSIKNKYWFN